MVGDHACHHSGHLMSAIADVAERVENELRRAQKNGRPYPYLLRLFADP
jgi:hypothetical protein